jgi:PAS domain S-box-containing protein
VAEAGLAAGLQEVIEQEGVRALGFIPLVSGGRLMGKFMVYFNRPYAMSLDEIGLAQAVARTLALGIERQENESRLRNSEERLAAELADTKLLQALSAELITETHVEALYDKLLDAAVAIMRSEFASMQMFYPERGTGGELRLLAFRGFNPEAAAFWEWVDANSLSTCGAALRSGARVLVPDVEQCEWMAGTEDLRTYRNTAIRAVQSSPLISRSGKIVGMMSTHWKNPYQPSERQLRLLDILARQAADLIERKRGEEALRASEQFNRSLVESSRDCTMTLAPNGILSWISETGLSLLRISDSSQVIGKSWIDFWTGADRVAAGAAVAAAAGGGSGTFVGYFPVAGQPKWWDVAVSPISDAKGRPARLLAVSRDITERRQAEEQLHESELRFRATFDNAGIGMALVGLDGRWLEVNDPLCAITGYPREELLSSTFTDITHPDDQMARWRQTRRLLAGEVPTYSLEKRYLRKDGSTTWVSITVSLMHNGAGAPLMFIGAVQDINQRKRAEQALRQSEARYRTLYESIDEGFCVIEVLFDQRRQPVDYRFLEVNPSFEKQTGIKDAPGRRMREIAPDHEDRWFTLFGEVALTGEPARFEYPADQLQRWYEGYAYRLGEAAEHRVAIIFNDITGRKRAEQDLRAFASDLEQRVAARTRELVESQSRLRALATDLNLAEQRERKRMAADLHDYLAQLLVLGKMKLAQGKRLVAEHPVCADFIKQTEDVLAEALTYTRTLVADLSPSVLHDFGLPPALRWLGERMQQQQLAVTTHIEADDVTLPEDQAVLLFQSVRELLINAAKHGKTSHATVRLAKQDARLHIEVQDEGAGFDVAAAAAVADMPTAQSSKYGLFSIRERMIALGGWFELQSEPGKGTKARLTLPLPAAKAGECSMMNVELEKRPTELSDYSTLEIKHSPFQQHTNRVRVLLVDDHAMVRQGLRTVLESYADVEVVGEAANGEEAVAGADEWQPAVVVMDINMPKLNGVDATTRIKARHPHMLVIGLSVNANAEAQEAMARAGAARLLTKEAAVDELYRAIQDVLVRR